MILKINCLELYLIDYIIFTFITCLSIHKNTPISRIFFELNTLCCDSLLSPFIEYHQLSKLTSGRKKQVVTLRQITNKNISTIHLQFFTTPQGMNNMIPET